MLLSVWQKSMELKGRWKKWSVTRCRWNDWRSPSYLHNAHKTFGIVVLIWFHYCFYEKWTIASQFISKMHQMRACLLDGTRLDAHQPSADVTTLGYLTIALLVLSWNDPNRKKTLPFDSFMIRSWFWVPYFWKFPKKSRKIAVGEKAPRV